MKNPKRCVITRVVKSQLKRNGAVYNARRHENKQDSHRPQTPPPVLPPVKGKVFQYSLPSVGPGADPGVQAVSPQVT